MGRRPRVVAEATAAEARVAEARAVETEVVDAWVAMGARTPSQDLRGAEAVALVEDSRAGEVETTTVMTTLTSAGRQG